MWCRVTVPKLRVPVAAVQSHPSWGSAPLSVGFLMWMGNPAQTTGCRVKLYLLWLFSSQKGLTDQMLGYDHISVGTRVLNQECSALVGTSQKNFTLPSNPCIPGLGFYQTIFVILLDFSNKQWNAKSWPEGKPSIYWRGKEHNIQMTHGSVGEVMAACHSLGCGFVVQYHMEWMHLGCDDNEMAVVGILPWFPRDKLLVRIPLTAWWQLTR